MAASVAAMFGASGTARAGGFEVPELGARALGRGGAYVVGVKDLTAVVHNPATLAKQRGTTIMYNHGLVFHNTSFARSPLGTGLPDPQAAWGADAGTEFDKVRDGETVFPFSVSAAVASDFGLENWTFAAGLFGPHAVGKRDFPEYGPQSFMLTDMDIILAYYSLAAAWKFRDIFGIGATVQYVDLIQMKYSLVVDSVVTPGLNPIPDEASTQLTTELDLKDRAGATAHVGVWYRPHQRVELGLSSRVVPIFIQAEGGVNVDKETLVTQDITVKLPFVLPAILRGGVRYIHDKGDGEVFDIELAAVYENWRTIKSFELEFDGAINGQQLEDLSIAKNWRDTVSVRLGGDYNALPPYLTVRAGGFYETAAVTKNFSYVDFPSFARGGIAAGVTGGYKGIYLTVGYMHVFQEDRVVNELGGKAFQQRPIASCPDRCDGLSGVPANSGTFKTSYDMLTLGLDIRFRELLAGRRKRKEEEKAKAKAKAKANEDAKPAEATPEATPEPTPDPDEPAKAPEPEPTLGPAQPESTLGPDEPAPEPTLGPDEPTLGPAQPEPEP